MQHITSQAVEKGGVTTPLLHCFFHPDGSVTHYAHDVDQSLAASLPNMYAVCIAKGQGPKREVLGGMVVKTSHSHHREADFASSLMSVCQGIGERFGALAGEDCRFLPARLGFSAEGLPTDTELLRVLVMQYAKFSAAGAA